MENIFFEKKELKYCGNNVIIGKTVRIRKPQEVVIGDNVIIDDFTYIAPSMDIGDYVHISSNCSFIGGPGYVKIGKFSTMASGCRIVAGSNDYRDGDFSLPTIPEEFCVGGIIGRVILGEYVILGCNTVVLPDTCLPDGLAAGAFSLLRGEEYDSWTLYAGILAKKVRKRDCSVPIAQTKKLYESGCVDIKHLTENVNEGMGTL